MDSLGLIESLHALKQFLGGSVIFSAASFAIAALYLDLR